MNYHIYTNGSLFILTKKALLRRLFNEELSPKAQIQKGFTGPWKSLNDTPQWRFFYDFTAGEDRDWILLKKQEKSRRLKQKGPYSTKQIRFFLKTELCHSHEFIWKKGFTEWKRISLVPDFSTHPAHTIADLLTQQSRKYKNQKAEIVRYSPSAPALDWDELQKSAYWTLN